MKQLFTYVGNLHKAISKNFAGQKEMTCFKVLKEKFQSEILHPAKLSFTREGEIFPNHHS